MTIKTIKNKKKKTELVGYYWDGKKQRTLTKEMR
jgi:hypothetical protein